MTNGWGRLQDGECSILTENAFRIYPQGHKVRLNAYNEPQARFFPEKGHIFPEFLALRLQTFITAFQQSKSVGLDTGFN
jgi:hypothetical protein